MLISLLLLSNFSSLLKYCEIASKQLVIFLLSQKQLRIPQWKLIEKQHKQHISDLGD